MTFEEKLEIMTEAGVKLAQILKTLALEVKPGRDGLALNKMAEELIYDFGCRPAFKNYRPPFARSFYPTTLCFSINQTIVHGYPSDRVVKDGDVVKLDLGLEYKKMFSDSALTVGVGELDPKVSTLIDKTKAALAEAIRVSRPGKTIGDVGAAIERVLTRAGFWPIKNLCGHDIGEKIHGNLQVLNFGQPGQGVKIKPEMFFTIEPMASLTSDYGVAVDDFVFKTPDDSIATHFEATVAVLKDETRVLTPIL
ncbi:MAG: type I methionyl aminopeptidase [Patescibacteria group bacterium]|nr:type I methionyl aminopeptidase [Patescibacteria group bacterium]MCL5257948.1 type I methionyl aminopeptidase [Patescibacteria group bacterium]